MLQASVTEQSPDDAAVVSMVEPAPLVTVPPTLKEIPAWTPVILPPPRLFTVPVALDRLWMDTPVFPEMMLAPSLVTVPPSNMTVPYSLPRMALAPRLLITALLAWV